MITGKILSTPAFTAKYIKSATVQKILFENGMPKCSKVSCIELDPANAADVDAVFKVAEDWDTNEGYPNYISTSINYPAIEEEGRNKFYAITTQKDNYGTPDADKILAISQVYDCKDYAEIEYLQVKPSKVTDYDKPYKFKYVGTAMLNLFKELFAGKKIELYSRPSVIEFYEKNNFIVEDELNPSRMSYEA